MNDSTNLQPPSFDPTWPTYPELPQLVKVTGGPVGGNVYPGSVMQYAGGLTFRSREPCYVIEPNGIALGAAIYDCRLVGSYLGLPLYATNCCPGGSSFSSAAPVTQTVARTSLGKTNSAGTGTTLSLPSLTVPSGSLLVVVASALGVAEVPSATFGPYTLDVDGDVALPVGAAFPGELAILSSYIPVGRTDTLTLSVPTAAVLTMQALYVTGLSYFVSDQEVGNSGLLTNPDTGVSGNTTFPVEYVQGAFALLTPPGFTWQNGFASGGQDVAVTVSLTATTVTEGWETLNAIGQTDAALLGAPASWAGLLVTYG